MAEQPIRVFYSYSHKDMALRDELETHLAALKRSGTIQGWSDRAITGGQEWAGQIDKNLEAADLILLLVSADFIASDYCYDMEMAQAMEKHAAGTARVIPIILRPVEWDTTPFYKLQALPTGAQAVTTWANRDESWVDVVKGLRRAIQSLKQERQARDAAVQPAPGDEKHEQGKRQLEGVSRLNLSAAPEDGERAREVSNPSGFAAGKSPSKRRNSFATFWYKGHTIVLGFGIAGGLQSAVYDGTVMPIVRVDPSAWGKDATFTLLSAFTVVEDGQKAEYLVMGFYLRWSIKLYRNNHLIFEDT